MDSDVSFSTTVPRDSHQTAVVRDLLTILNDPELYNDYCDVYLVSQDKVQVPACRFILASRSPVLKRMLYGSFREAKSSTICMMGYDSFILRTVVEFCNTNNFFTTTTFVQEFCGGGLGRLSENVLSEAHSVVTEAEIRKLVQLVKAADFLELVELEEQATNFIRAKMIQQVPLTCAVFDESDADSELYRMASSIIEGRPYMALDVQRDYEGENIEGGITCLRAERLFDVMVNQSIAAGELFLFRMLNRWYEANADNPDKSSPSSSPPASEAFDVAHQCCRYMNFENIEPQRLFDEVQNCKFVSPDHIFGAVAKQALRASQHGVWSLPCRGSTKATSVDRVLVEGCGVQDANGVYFCIAGHAKGNLYSKREVSCGQQSVYTLSCSKRDEEYYECRLFSTKLLTHRSVMNLCKMQRSSVIDPVLQPVMQVLSIEKSLIEDDIDSGMTMREGNAIPSQLRMFYCCRLSDGEHHMYASMSLPVQRLVEGRIGADDSNHEQRSDDKALQIQQPEITDNTIIKVLDFGLYEVAGVTGIHLRKVAVVNSNPGQVYGCPIRLESLSPEDFRDRSQEEDDSGDNANGLQTLYSCVLAVDSNQRRERPPFPQSGWEVEGHGMAPSPTCTFIHGTSGASSSAQCPAVI